MILRRSSVPGFTRLLRAMLVLAGMAAARTAGAQTPILPPVPLRATPDIVIGCALPLSGEDAPAGQRALQGALVAAQVFDEVGPDRRSRRADTGGTPEAPRGRSRSWRATRALGIVGRRQPESPAPRRRPIARVPIITPPSARASRAGDFVFRALLTPRDQAEAVALYATDAAPRGRFAVVYPDDPFGRDLARAFSEGAASRGGKVVRASAYRSAADLAPAVTRPRPPRAAPEPVP
jgi:ABC-type branched-subunit amino acid transport system substrate-binding protein